MVVIYTFAVSRKAIVTVAQSLGTCYSHEDFTAKGIIRDFLPKKQHNCLITVADLC